MVLGIPGGRDLFSQLQTALARRASPQGVPISAATRDQLHEMLTLAHDLAERPTRIAEIIPSHTASFVGACDAAPCGLGGVWLPPARPSKHTPYHPPILWRLRTPPKIFNDILTADNPSGRITINDLELAAILAHSDILAEMFNRSASAKIIRLRWKLPKKRNVMYASFVETN